MPDAANIRGRVYSYILARGRRGATEGEIEVALGLGGNTVRPRLWELRGNVPAGRLQRPAVIEMTPERRNGMRVFKALKIG